MAKTPCSILRWMARRICGYNCVPPSRGITVEAHFMMNVPQYENVGKKGVMRFGFSDIPETRIFGVFVFDNERQISNVMVFRKTDFTLGDSDAVFQTTVSNLLATDQPAKKTP